MPRNTLQAGIKHELSLTTGPEHSARRFFENLPDVFATPFLSGLMEQTCAELVQKHLEPGEQSVGTAMDLKHLAPTPLGMKVTVKAQLTKVSGRQLIFHLEAYDEVEKIGEATHYRFIINAEKFNQRVAEKAQKLSD
ncbi:MAG: thioesterase family protein [Deltaproteobacteria bacterium]|nr:thioesterase family protein [Deltaproteobacteria bacterium]MBW2067266.1 thioesterase family protein [Deltaproteobacteria bacterium]